MGKRGERGSVPADRQLTSAGIRWHKPRTISRNQASTGTFASSSSPSSQSSQSSAARTTAVGAIARPQDRTSVRPSAVSDGAGLDPDWTARLHAVARLRPRLSDVTAGRDDLIGGWARTSRAAPGPTGRSTVTSPRLSRPRLPLEAAPKPLRTQTARKDRWAAARHLVGRCVRQQRTSPPR